MYYQRKFDDLLEGIFLQSSAFTAYAVGKRPCEENNWTVSVEVHELVNLNDDLMAAVMQQNILTYHTLKPYEEYIEKNMPRAYIYIYKNYKKLNMFASMHSFKPSRNDLENFLKANIEGFELTKEDIERIICKHEGFRHDG